MTTRCRWSPRRKCAPAAWPTRSAVSAVMGSMLVVPRIPSVPENLRVMRRSLAGLADPAQEAGGDRMDPGDEEEENGPAGKRDRSRVSDAAGERDERSLGGPFVPRLPELPRFLTVLPSRAGKRQDQDCTV